MTRPVGSWGVVRRVLDACRSRRRRGGYPLRRRARTWQGRGLFESLEGRALLSVAPGGDSPGDHRFFGAIATPGQVDTHTLTTTSTSQLWFDSTTHDRNLSWSVSGPQGVLRTQAFSAGDAQLVVPAEVQPSARGLLPAGTYTVTVSGAGDATGGYSFRILDLAFATPLSPGTTVTGALPASNGTSLYTFAGAAGDDMSFTNVASAGPGGSWRLLDPFGNQVFATSIEASARVGLPATGTYTLILEGSTAATQPSSFSFIATCHARTPPPALTGTTIAPGAVLAGTVPDGSAAPAGYTFTLAAPTRLWFDSRTAADGAWWTLTGPQGLVRDRAAFAAGDANLGLLPAGTYGLTVSGRASAAFAFCLLDTAAATSLSFGVATTVALDPANATQLHRFNGTAGQVISVGTAVVSQTGPAWYSDGTCRLFDQYGNQVDDAWTLGGSRRLTLPTTGGYTLVVAGRGPEAGTTTATVTVWTVVDTTTPLALGAAVADTCNVPGQVKNYTFTLATPTRLWFDSRTASAAWWSLTGPQGAVGNDVSFAWGDQALGLLPAGGYTLSVRGDVGTTFAFSLLDAAAAPTLSPGVSTTATLDPANSMQLYRFSGAAGQVVYLDSVAVSMNGLAGYWSGGWRLLDPNGAPVGYWSILNADIGRLTLPTTGAYTLVIAGDASASGTMTATFTVWDVVDTTTAVVPGAAVADTIGAPGEVKSYSFALATPTRLWFDSRTLTDGASWRLTGPQGTVREQTAFAAGDQALGRLPAGAYTLEVSGVAGTAFAFSLLDAAAAPSLALGVATTATLDPRNSARVYRLSGTAGQVVYVDATTTSPAWGWGGRTTWTLFDPDGNPVGGNASFLSNSGRLTLPTTGTYTLELSGSNSWYSWNDGPLTSTFTVWNVVDTTAAISLGAVVTDTIDAPTQVKRSTFTLAAPARLWFDSRTAAAGSSWTLTGPQGTTRSGRFGDGDQNLGLLPAGAYTLSATGAVGQAFAFSLLDVAAVTPLTPETTVAGTLPAANATVLYAFNGLAGDDVSFTNIEFGGTDGTWRLLDPSGNQVFAQPIRANARVVLQATGTYTLVLEAGPDATPASSYAFSTAWNAPPVTQTTIGTTIAPGTPVTGTVDAPDGANYTFTLAAPTRLWFDNRTASYTTLWSLTGPQGTIRTATPFAAGDQRLRLLTAGTYTLSVTGAVGETFAFSLVDAAAAPSLSLDVPTTATLDPADSLQLYRFEGTAGQVVYVDTTGSSGPPGLWWPVDRAAWQLLSPEGNPFGGPWSVNSDSGRLALPTTGAYTLVLSGMGIVYGDQANPLTTTFAVPLTTTFAVRNIVDTTTPIALDTAVAGTIDSPGQVKNHTFTLAAPTLLWIDSVTSGFFPSSGPTWSLTGPQGIDQSGPFGDRNLGLLPAGSYTLSVSSFVGGSFAFSLRDAAAAPSLSLGVSATVTLYSAAPLELYRFSGTAGQVVFFDTTSYSSSWWYGVTWTLFDPVGNALGSPWGFTDDSGRLTLPTTGSYTLELAARGPWYVFQPTTTTFTMRDVGDTTAALTLGVAVADTIGMLGQLKHYTFTLAAPTRLWFDVRTASSAASWGLTGPQGTVQAATRFDSGDRALGLLPAGGYTLSVRGDVGTAFAFSLLDAAAAPTLSLGVSTTATLDPADSTQLYRFSGTAGQVVSFDTTSSSPWSWWYYDPPTWRLFGPDGSQVGGAWNFGADSGRLTLPTTGTYTLELIGRSSWYGTEPTTTTFTVFDVGDTTAALTLGAAVADTIGVPDQAKNYTFTLATPTRLWFDSRTASAASWDLTGPQGAIRIGTRFDSGDQDIGLLPAGAYTLSVRGPAGDAFAFSLLDVAAAPSLSLGISTTAALAPAGATRIYRFGGTAGQVVYLDNTGFSMTAPAGSGTFAKWRLLDEDGSTLFTNRLDADSGRVRLPTTGAYTLVLDGTGTAVGTTTATFTVWNVTDDARLVWGSAGRDVIAVEALSATTANVFLNGYRLGTLASGTPLAIDGRGGVDAITVVGSRPAGAVATAIGPATITLGTQSIALAGIATMQVTNINEPPAAPTAVTAAAGNGQVRLSWTAPVVTGGAPVTDYLIEYSGDRGASFTRFRDAVSAGTSALVTGLVNGTRYVFRVAAVNEVGTGGFSPLSSPVAPRPVPGIPRSLTGVAGVGQVSLSWAAPVDRGGSAISEYRVQHSRDGGLSWQTFAAPTAAVPTSAWPAVPAAPPATTATITGLANGVPYLFRVGAVNGSGMGFTATTAAAIVPRTTPGVATGLTGVAGNGRVTLSWTAPASNGGAAISDYRVQYSSTNGMTWTTFADAVSAATTATVTGLTNGVSYVFRVAALNAAGVGGFTAKSAAVTPRTAPGVPTGLTATAVAGRVNLAWTAPAATGGAAISDYVVQYSNTNGATWTTFADATSASPSATVTGLTKGLSYVFRVAAVNAADRGAFSPKSTAVKLR